MNAPTARMQREFTRFVKFCVVGAVGAVVDFGTFNLLAIVLGMWTIPASALSFIAAVTSNFLWNRYWTYPDSRSKPIGRQATQFAAVNLVGLMIRTPIFAGSEALLRRALPGLPIPAALQSAAIASNLALAVAVVVVLFWNFAVNRLWTYSDVS